MKKIIYSLLLLGWLICANSCFNSKYDYDHLFTDEHAKILSVKNSETVVQSMSSLDVTSGYDMIILKGGSQPQDVANAEVVTWSDEELKEYSSYNGLNCKIIPSGTYALSDTKIHFGSGERAKHVLIDFKPSELAKVIDDNPDVTYLLPLKVISEDIVMESKKGVIIQIKMNIPTVTLWGIPSEIVRVETKEQMVTLQAKLTMYERNLGDFACPLLYAGNEYVTQYNKDMGIGQYQPLPEGSYELNDISFKSGVENSTVNVVLHKDKLVENQFYVLPLKIGVPDNDKVKAGKAVYYIPIFNPSHVYEAQDCNRSNWDILFCNSDDITGKDARAILDNDMETFWHSAWQGGFCYDYEDCYDYDKTMGRPYKVCLGKRNLPITIVLDMKESVWIHSLGIVQRLGASNRYIKGVEFYVSDDDTFLFNSIKEGGNLSDYSDVALNNWKKVYADSSVPQDAGIIWRQVLDSDLNKEMRGRFLKIRYTATYHNSQDVMSMAELYVKKVSKVDGVIVE